MSSTASNATDDRTARARIRDAAIRCFAEHGVTATTARKVASAADVSPGLVIHHFGTMDGLRRQCDAHVAALLREQKRDAIARGIGVDVMAMLREVDGRYGPIMAYLARILVDDAPAVADLVDRLVDDAEDALADGVDAGMVRPASDARARAVVLTLWSLGALVMHRHLERLLGVDLTATEDTQLARYVAPAYELLGTGVFTEDFAGHVVDNVRPTNEVTA